MLFLAFLKRLMNIGIPAMAVIDYITMRNTNGFMLGHELAWSRSPEEVQAFFSFLSTFLEEGQQQDILTLSRWFSVMHSLVRLITKKEWTIGHFIACHQDADTFLSYCDFLRSLNHLENKGDITNYLREKTNHDYDMYHLLLVRDDGKKLYQLICHAIFDGMEDKKKLGEKKELVFAYMLTLPKEEQTLALQQALTPTHPLHDFFAIKRGNFEPNDKRGLFAKIKAALKKLYDGQDVTKASLFTSRNLQTNLFSQTMPSNHVLQPIYEPRNNQQTRSIK